MDQNRPKEVKNIQKGPKLKIRKGQDCSKYFGQIGPEISTKDKNLSDGPKWVKIGQKRSKCYQMCLDGLKWTKIWENRSKCDQMDQKRPKRTQIGQTLPSKDYQWDWNSIGQP